MNRPVYPEDGPEWIPEAAIDEEHELNLELLEQSQASDFIDYRTAFIGKLIVHSAIENGSGWALFDLDVDAEGKAIDLDYEATESTCGLGDNEQSKTLSYEVLLYSYFTEPQPAKQLPILRTVTNEVIKADGRLFCLSHDLMLDPFDDIYMMIDAIQIKLIGQRPPKPFNVPAGLSPEDRLTAPPRSLGSLFRVRNVILYLSNCEPLPSFYVLSALNDDEDIAPFGHPVKTRDKAFTLGHAAELLDKVIDLQPTETGAGNRICFIN